MAAFITRWLHLLYGTGSLYKDGTAIVHCGGGLWPAGIHAVYGGKFQYGKANAHWIFFCNRWGVIIGRLQYFTDTVNGTPKDTHPNWHTLFAQPINLYGGYGIGIYIIAQNELYR
jgi:hypothetical protein